MLRIAVIFMIVGMLLGCPLDTFFGVAAQPDGTVKTDPQSPAHQIGKAVSDGGSGTPFALIGGALSLIANIYQAVRGKQLNTALAVTVAGIESFTESETGKAVSFALKSRLANLHAHENVGPIMSKVVKAVTK